MSDYEVVDLGGNAVQAVELEDGDVQIVTPVAAGPRGPRGLAGADGMDGGSRWFTGSGAPTSVPGSEPGDFYIDTVTGNFYELI